MGNRLNLLEAFTRKARTLFSLAHSAVLVFQDGVSPRSMKHTERLRYLELQEALNWKKNLVVYDIGANIGDFAAFMAGLPSVSCVYCFEPIPDVCEHLRKRADSLGKIACLQVALGDRNDTRLMNVNDFHASSSLLDMEPIHVEEFPGTKSSRPVEITMMRLGDAVDKYHLPLPDFIKIDVQGFEDRVISGATDIVKKARHVMLELSLVKLYEDSALITDVNVLMRSLGFRLIGIVHNVVGKSGEILQIDGLYRNEKFSG